MEQYTPRVKRKSASEEELLARRTGEYETSNDDAMYAVRPRTSARRYQQPTEGYVIQDGKRRFVVHPQNELPPRAQKPQRNIHWLTIVGLTMFIVLSVVVGLNMLSSWWNTKQDDLKYGRPRTFQVDQIVGHKDSAQNPSHFIALNLSGKIEVIEIPGGDASHAQIYTGPTLFGTGEDLIPVTLTFADENGDGKIDMIVHVQDQAFIYVNHGTSFVPPKSF